MEVESTAVNVEVELSIVFEPTTGYVPASNGEGVEINCYYKFTGGTDGNGNVEVAVEGQQTNIVITLTKTDGTNKQFDIVSGFWKDQPLARMYFEIKGRNKLKIIDKADLEDVVNYTVIVTPQTGPTRLILCDPRVANRWDNKDDDEKP